MTQAEHIPEVIKLQLKKPRSWNWQLSTSKSSPHICLPVIQLYDAKGKLVLEARDDGQMQRRSWHSSLFESEEKKRQLQRCKSDSLQRKLDRSIIGVEEVRSKVIKCPGADSLLKCADVTENKLNEKVHKKLHYLRKSSSDFLDCKSPPKRNSLQTNRSLLEIAQNPTRSDDLFGRKLKYNEESLKRAEIDGFKELIQKEGLNAKPKKKRIPMMVEHVVMGRNEAEKPQVTQLRHTRYTTRTSSAGTLVISEESFKYGHRRRRRGDDRGSTGLHSRGCSRERNPGTRQNSERNLYDNRNSSSKHRNHKDENSNYVVQEPITPVEGKTFPIPEDEKPRRIKRRKEKRLLDDGSSPSYEHRSNGTKGQLVEDRGSADTDLLQLVRRLSSNDHVKMGANVSRHSAKGLSGRRSQSSGSICNGKRHSEGKICSSLPSYLDDRDTNGYNNNHDCEKPPLDETDRIPPLGDGAPLHWKFSDNQTVLCDQGYGSERSPEEEYPPPLPEHDGLCHHHLEAHACYPFITPESTFVVKLAKGSRGLGLSVTGGVDSNGAWPGLIRIKRLFPHQPASTCGLLSVGDLLLEVNGITLTGLTNYEALEVLRTVTNQVELKICRPPPDVLNCVSPISEVPPPPPRREPPNTLNLPSNSYISPEDEFYHGEFDITLKKIQGSLGFTLRKEDDSALGHYVRALVREPALTDGRIRAGDKIIAVNDVEISAMSHEQAVQFLRQCGEVVKLKLYRDAAQTPVAALSPTETTPRASFSRKTNLRQEAVDMLNDIAVRKLLPGNQENTYRRSLSPNASPRRLRRHPCPSDASQITDSITYDEQFHEGLLQKCSHPYDDDLALFTIENDDDKPSRPSSLDLYNPNQTPVAARKPRFNFSLAHNQYELNNLDPEVLDAPNLTYNLGGEEVASVEVEADFPQEPASMPHISCESSAFSYKNPAYQSAHPPCSEAEDRPRNGKAEDTNMKKWKGVSLNASQSDSKPRKILPEEYEVLAIELNRGWNSRLGFSLQGAAGVTYVSAVHADSVAAKDGRLKPGDRVIKVNDESVENMTTNEIIDLLRIVRGPVCIVVSRVKSNEDCPRSNAEN